MLKETKTEETIVFFVTRLSLVAFQLGGGPGPWQRLWRKVSFPRSQDTATHYRFEDCTGNQHFFVFNPALHQLSYPAHLVSYLHRKRKT